MPRRSDETIYSAPTVDDLESSKPRRKTIAALLLNAADLKQEIARCKAELDDLIDQLLSHSQRLGTTSIRHEGVAFYCSESEGKRTLDRVLLIENGVDPNIIEASMKTGKPFWKKELAIAGGGGDEE